MIRELPLELAKIANEELGEKPNQTKDDVQHLKDWISKQPHLKARTDDQWLVAMLRGCKFSLEKVKQKLDLYYTLRTTAPDITLRIKPTDPKFIDFFRLGTCIVLPKANDKLFPRVVLIRAGAFDPNTHSVADLMCMLYYLVQILVMEDDIATVLGIKVMVDYQDVTMSHFVQATPSMLKKMVAVCQVRKGYVLFLNLKDQYSKSDQYAFNWHDSMPLRLKGSHHINLPSGVEKIFILISGFLNEKAKQRLKVHKSCDELSEFIPKETLPKDYGGTGDSVEKITEYWAAKIKDYKSWMQQEEQFGTVESKRPGPPINPDMMGVDGSFRKLEID